MDSGEEIQFRASADRTPEDVMESNNFFVGHVIMAFNRVMTPLLQMRLHVAVAQDRRPGERLLPFAFG
jgi:hypothetical protein